MTSGVGGWRGGGAGGGCGDRAVKGNKDATEPVNIHRCTEDS